MNIYLGHDEWQYEIRLSLCPLLTLYTIESQLPQSSRSADSSYKYSNNIQDNTDMLLVWLKGKFIGILKRKFIECNTCSIFI